MFLAYKRNLGMINSNPHRKNLLPIIESTIPEWHDKGKFVTKEWHTVKKSEKLTGSRNPTCKAEGSKSGKCEVETRRRTSRLSGMTCLFSMPKCIKYLLLLRFEFLPKWKPLKNELNHAISSKNLWWNKTQRRITNGFSGISQMLNYLRTSNHCYPPQIGALIIGSNYEKEAIGRTLHLFVPFYHSFYNEFLI